MGYVECNTSLSGLLEAQLALQIDSYGIDPSTLDGDAMAEFVRWNAYALEDELHEATAEVGWKPWATSRHLNRERFKQELVDLLHFYMNLCLVAGITGEELADGYFAKRAVNAKRQIDGYDGVSTKDADGRALDEPA